MLIKALSKAEITETELQTSQIKILKLNIPYKTIMEVSIKCIESSIIEKDYYVTRVINALSGVENEYFRLIFAGGTCLAKAHKIVKRMMQSPWGEHSNGYSVTKGERLVFLT